MSSARFVFLSMVLLYTAVGVRSSRFIYDNLVRYVERMSHPSVIPQTSVTAPVKVSVGLALVNIVSVDIETRCVHVDAWMNLNWDSSITFDPRRYNNLSNVRLHSSKMWLPDIAVYNGDLSLVDNNLLNRMTIFSSGQAFWVPKSKIRVTCNVTDDSLAANTTCSIKIGSWTYSNSHIHLDDDKSNFQVGEFNTNSRFEIVEHSVVKQTMKYGEEHYETLLFTFTFRQR